METGSERVIQIVDYLGRLSWKVQTYEKKSFLIFFKKNKWVDKKFYFPSPNQGIIKSFPIEFDSLEESINFNSKYTYPKSIRNYKGYDIYFSKCIEYSLDYNLYMLSKPKYSVLKKLNVYDGRTSDDNLMALESKIDNIVAISNPLIYYIEKK